MNDIVKTMRTAIGNVYGIPFGDDKNYYESAKNDSTWAATDETHVVLFSDNRLMLGLWVTDEGIVADANTISPDQELTDTDHKKIDAIDRMMDGELYRHLIVLNSRTVK